MEITAPRNKLLTVVHPINCPTGDSRGKPSNIIANGAATSAVAATRPSLRRLNSSPNENIRKTIPNSASDSIVSRSYQLQAVPPRISVEKCGPMRMPATM